MSLWIRPEDRPPYLFRFAAGGFSLVAGGLRNSAGHRLALVACLLLSSLCLLSACSDNKADTLAEARELQREGKFAPTIEPLRELLDQDSNQPEANFLLGRALMRTGDSSLAVWPLRKAVESPEFAVEAGIMLARAMAKGRTPVDSAEAAGRVLELDPDNVEALALRAQNLIQANKLKDGLREIERVVELDPDNLSILVPRILALLKLDRIDEAEEALEAAQKVLADSEAKVSQSLLARVCVAEALFSFERGDRELADKQHADCLEAHPSSPVVVKSVVDYYDNIGQPDRADEVLENAFAESRDPSFRRAMARRAGQRGEFERQEELMREHAEEVDTAQAWFLLADFYAQQERYDEACEQFEKVVALEPEPIQLFAYADTLILAGRLDEAAAVGERIEDQQQLRDLIRGRILLEQGDAAGALKWFESGIRLWPNNPGARYLAGQAAEQLGDFDRAISEYREAERANPRQTEAGLALSRILAETGSERPTFTAIQRYVKSHPRDPEGMLLALQVAHRSGKHRISAEALVRLSRLPGQAELAMAEQARMVAELDDPEEGVKVLETSLLDFTEPQNAIVLEQLLALLAEVGRHDSARARIATSLAAHPEEAVFHELAGKVELAAGAGTDAVRAEFERAIELDPAQHGALMGLGDLAAAAGDVDAAVAYYDRAVAADADDPRAGIAAAKWLVEKGAAKEAESRLLAVLKDHPRNVPAAAALAKLLATEGRDLERALDYARRADYFRSMPEAAEVLGWVLILNGEPLEAVEPLKRTVSQRPNSASAQLYLGQALARTGDPEGARRAFERVIESSGPEADQARAELVRLGEAS